MPDYEKAGIFCVTRITYWYNEPAFFCQGVFIGFRIGAIRRVLEKRFLLSNLVVTHILSIKGIYPQTRARALCDSGVKKQYGR